MELLQLRYFQMVARTQHMTRCAENLNIAQPALSKTISALEKELGVKLFDRKGKYIELNTYGKLFLERVDEALYSLDMGKKQITNLSTGNFGEVKLLVLSSSNMLPNLLREFKNIYPNITFKISQHLSNSSTINDFDLCIQSSYTKPNPHDFIILLEEEIYLAVPKNHKFEGYESIFLNESVNEDFITLKEGSNFRTITDIFCNACGFKPNIVFESDSPSTVRDLINAGLGISFIPGISWGMESSENIKFLHIKDPVCKRYIYISSKVDKHLSESVKLFKNFTIDFYNNLNNPD